MSSAAMPTIAEFRQQLETRLADVMRRHAKIDAHLHNVDRDLPDDWSDRAQAIENDEVLEALDDHARADVAKLKGALRRIDEGTFGTCIMCEEPVGDRRLAAIPWATLCITCASANE